MDERWWFTQYDYWTRALMVSGAEALVSDDVEASSFFMGWMGQISQNLWMADPKVYLHWKEGRKHEHRSAQ